MSTTRKVTVRKNSGADVGTEERINLIEGANITLTVADDAANKEVDVTITSGGGGGGDAWLDQFFPATDPDVVKGSYPAVKMEDAVTTDVYQMFMIPDDISTITTASVILLSDASGNIYWNCDTDGGACAESYQANTDSISSNASAMTLNTIKCLDISAAFTGFTGGDFVGLHFARIGGNVLDTIGDVCYYLGILIQGLGSE